MGPKDVDRIVNSVDPDQTAPLGPVWSGSTLFVQTCLSENLGTLQYYHSNYITCLTAILDGTVVNPEMIRDRVVKGIKESFENAFITKVFQFHLKKNILKFASFTLQIAKSVPTIPVISCNRI